MKFMLRHHISLVTGAWLAAVMMAFAPKAGQAEPVKKILLAPFEIMAGEDLAYLQHGIEEMLASRLSWEGRVAVLRSSAKAPLDQEDALSQAVQRGADYVLLGSLTVLGGRVSTDARVIDAGTQKQVLSFSRTGAQQSDVIDHIDQLAADVNARLFGRGKVSRTMPAEAPKAVVPPPEEPPSIYQHPEKLLAKEAAEGQQRDVTFTGEAAQMPLKLRSRKQQGQIASLTAGDVDGDGRVEIVTATTAGDLIVQRIEQGRWIKVAQVEGTGHYIGVDAVDVNGNGRSEVFVTNFDNSINKADSFVMEWDGRSLKRTARRLNWYFRAVNLPGRGRVLVGQHQGVSDRFGTGIYIIGWQAGGYDGVERLPLFRSLNVFGFGYGKVRAREDEEVVAYNANGYVRILKRNGEEEWVTSERFGGGASFVQFPNKMDGIETDYVYLNPRLELFDLDGDGLQEILVVGNEDSARVLENVRFFKQGRLECLKWNELGMTTVLRTPSLTKYIADFTLADLEGDGRPEVVLAIVQKESGMVSKGTSYLVVFDLIQPLQKQN